MLSLMAIEVPDKGDPFVDGSVTTEEDVYIRALT
jgi:hypothetical protein